MYTCIYIYIERERERERCACFIIHYISILHMSAPEYFCSRHSSYGVKSGRSPFSSECKCSCAHSSWAQCACEISAHSVPHQDFMPMHLANLETSGAETKRVDAARSRGVPSRHGHRYRRIRRSRARSGALPQAFA